MRHWRLPGILVVAALSAFAASGCFSASNCNVHAFQHAPEGPAIRICETHIRYDDETSRLVVVSAPTVDGLEWEKLNLEVALETGDDVHAAFSTQATSKHPSPPLNMERLASGPITVGQYVSLCGTGPAWIGFHIKHAPGSVAAIQVALNECT